MHWTYESLEGERLRQGDVLARTDALNEILATAHGHFLNPKYKRFLVLTQSCDLEPRGKLGFKAPYISIAVVRELEDAISADLRALIRTRPKDHWLNGHFVSEDVRQRFSDRVKTLLNNNNEEFLFLRADTEANVPRDLCAFLRVSITLRHTHYDSLLAAKRTQLSTVFRAKLGWMAGYIYSRVATPDLDDAQLRQLSKDYVREACQWVKPDIFRVLDSEITSQPEYTADQITSMLSKRVPADRSRKDLVINALEAAVQDAGLDLNPADLERLVRAISARAEFRRATREVAPE